MKYRLLVLDIDGTVTNTEKKVTPRTKAAIKRLQEQGTLVAIASGRMNWSLISMEVMCWLLTGPGS